MIDYLRKSGAKDNWYVVDGSWAQPEGTKEEWLWIIAGIEDSIASGVMDDHYTGGRRLSVNLFPTYIEFYSPRNQSSDDDVVRIKNEGLPAWLEQAKKVLEHDH